MIRALLLLLSIFSTALFAYQCPSESSILKAIAKEKEMVKRANEKTESVQTAFSPIIKYFNQTLPWLIELQPGMMPPNNPDLIRFFQIKRTTERLYCYYQWAGNTGQLDNWLSIGLITSRTIIPEWQGHPFGCESFHRDECPFRFTSEHW
jgi:hypothetical protein